MVSKVVDEDVVESPEFEISNSGPIKKLRFKAEPGSVTVLRGPNGSGKTTALNDINRVMGGKAPKSTKRDGAMNGHVKAPGVTLRVTVAGNGRPSGDLEVTPVDVDLTIADIVDPGVKDPVAADRRRVEALVHVLQKSADLSRFDKAVEPGGIPVEDLASQKTIGCTDVVGMARSLKRDVDEYARDMEKDADDLSAEAEAIRELCAGIDLSKESDPDALEAEVEKARDALSQLRVRVDESKRLRESVGDVTAPTADEVQEAEENLRVLTNQSTAAAELVLELRDELRQAEENADNLKRLVDNADITLKRLRTASEAAKVVGAAPTDEELVAASQRLEAARKAQTDGASVRLAKEKAPIADKKETEAMFIREKAEVMRNCGKQVLLTLSELIGGELFQVDEDGRLLANHPKRGWMFYSEMSDGERWERAIKVVAEEFKETPHSLLLLPQAAWQDLDATARRAVVDAVKDTPLAIITGEAYGEKGEQIQAVKA